MTSNPNDRSATRMAPGGPRPPADVHATQPGGGIAPAEQGTAADANVNAEETTITPGGRRHRAHIHLMRAGQALALGRHGTIPRSALPMRRYPKPGVAGAANWITCGFWSNNSGSSIASHVASFAVPPPPVTAGSQIIYLFPGLEPDDGHTIIQPVLQWGDTGADEDGVNRTGNFWTAASWIVPAPDGHTYHTPHVRVNPATVLTGAMTLLNRAAGGNIYKCEFQGLAGTDFITPSMSELTWAMETLEAYETTGAHNSPYDLGAASEYPNAAMVQFTGIDLTTVAGPSPAGNWAPSDTVRNYGEHTVISRNLSTGGAINICLGGGPVVIS